MPWRAQSRARTVPFGATIPRKGFGLFQVLQGVPRKLAFEGIDTEQIGSLFVDRDDSVWMGAHDGVYRIHGKRVDHMSSADGLSSDDVGSFYQDREGNLWLVTSKGLDCFRDSRVITFSRKEGLRADLAASVLATDDGDVWIGNRDSLDLLHADQVTSIPIPGHRVTSLWQDHAKRLWVGIDNELTIYTRGRFQKINHRNGSPLGTTVAITEDGAQNIWVSVVGERRGIVRIRNQRVEDEFTLDQIPYSRLLAGDPAGGIWLGLGRTSLAHYRTGKPEVFPLRRSELPVSGLMVDKDGSVWASTSNGIVHSKNGEMKALTSKNGLPCDATFAAIRDNHAALWIYAKCGLISVADAELERWWRQPDGMIQSRLFDVFDGAMPGLTTFQPALSKSPDGRLWFVNDSVVQTIDPDSVQRNPVAPPVYVEGIRAERKDYTVSRLVRLPAHSRDVEIAYTALSYSIPQKVLFRYRLDGRDRDWQDAGTRRQAFYNDLPPGRYRFHVSACNSDGVWNQAGALLDFSIDPAYYQTRWFQAVCIAAFLAMLWGLYRFRLHRMAQRFNLRMEERVTERTRIARELHDTLLQSFQGLMLRLQVVDYLLPDGNAKNQLEQTLQRGDQAIAEGRTAVYDLRSSTTTTSDLAEAVKALGEELATPDSAAFRQEVVGAPRDLHPIIRDEIPDRPRSSVQCLQARRGTSYRNRAYLWRTGAAAAHP
jgi:streptogramin lyase